MWCFEFIQLQYEAKKSKVNPHKSHFLGLHAKTGLRICRPENFQIEDRSWAASLSSCKPGGEADLGNEAASHTSLVLDGGPWHTGAWHGKLAEQHQVETSWLYTVRHWTQKRWSISILSLNEWAVLDWDWPELGGYRNKDYKYSFSVGVTQAVPYGGVDNRLVKSVFSKPTDQSYVLPFHIWQV